MTIPYNLDNPNDNFVENFSSNSTNNRKCKKNEYKCTHQGCTAKWNENEKAFVCPCHNSKFSGNGDVLQGPAKLPLKCN